MPNKGPRYRYKQFGTDFETAAAFLQREGRTNRTKQTSDEEGHKKTTQSWSFDFSDKKMKHVRIYFRIVSDDNGKVVRKCISAKNDDGGTYWIGNRRARKGGPRPEIRVNESDKIDTWNNFLDHIAHE